MAQTFLKPAGHDHPQHIISQLERESVVTEGGLQGLVAGLCVLNVTSESAGAAPPGLWRHASSKDTPHHPQNAYSPAVRPEPTCHAFNVLIVLRQWFELCLSCSERPAKLPVSTSFLKIELKNNKALKNRMRRRIALSGAVEAMMV